MLNTCEKGKPEDKAQFIQRHIHAEAQTDYSSMN